jgi:general stress protein CsbA
MLSILGAIPLLSVPVVVYALFAFPSGVAMTEGLAGEAFSWTMPSEMNWVFTWGGLFLLLAIVCLFIEVLKSARATASAMVDTALTIVLFIACFLLFLLVPGFATTEFFLILMMVVLDFVAGFVIMVNTAQRTVSFDGQR